jgi:hypothetical protein
MVGMKYFACLLEWICQILYKPEPQEEKMHSRKQNIKCLQHNFF